MKNRSCLFAKIVLLWITALLCVATAKASSSTEGYSLAVGSKRFLWLNAQEAVTGAVWTSSEPNSVVILQQSTTSCEIEAMSVPTASEVVVQCTYYYTYSNPFSGALMTGTGFKSFLIYVNGGSGGSTDPDTVTITFDPQGGTASFTSVNRPRDGRYGALPTATREGYTFKGWYTNDGRTTSILLEPTYLISSLKCYSFRASWIKVNPTVAPTATPLPEQRPLSGSCGGTATWRYDVGRKTLELSGSGETEDCRSSSQPWRVWKDDIETVLVDGGITAIGECSFYQYDKIKSVVLSEGVEVIGEYAFYKCTALNGLQLPQSLQEIGTNAFVEVGITSLIVPANTETGWNCFMGCSSLETVFFCEGVTKVGYGAFSDCIQLKRVVLPTTLKTLGQWAFDGCKALRMLSIPSVANKDYDNFLTAIHDCANLRVLSIPEQFGSPFEYYFPTFISNVQILYYGGTKAQFDSSEFGKYAKNYMKSTAKVYYASELQDYMGSGQLIIPKDTTVIGAKAFYGLKNVRHVVCPASLTTIGSSAFGACSSLSIIEIPVGVTSIASNAFDGCPSDMIIVAKSGSAAASLALNKGFVLVND